MMRVSGVTHGPPTWVRQPTNVPTLWRRLEGHHTACRQVSYAQWPPDMGTIAHYWPWAAMSHLKKAEVGALHEALRETMLAKPVEKLYHVKGNHV